MHISDIIWQQTPEVLILHPVLQCGYDGDGADDVNIVNAEGQRKEDIKSIHTFSRRGRPRSKPLTGAVLKE